MGKVKQLLLPMINIWSWANGNEYTADEDTVILPPELAESDISTNEKWEEHASKGKTGKGKRIEGIAVGKEQLINEKVEQRIQEEKEQVSEREGR